MNYKNNSIIYFFKYTLIYILAILAILILFILYKNINKFLNYDAFELQQPTLQPTIQSMPTSFERTQLYGSLFLDELNKVIKNMTDPSIKYENKRVEIIRYSDALL